MRASVVVPLVPLTAAALGAATAGLLVSFPGDLGILATGTVLCWIGFMLWPWAVLPVGIVGGAVAGAMIGDGEVRSVVTAHVLVLAAGGAALMTRRAVIPDDERPARTGADVPMLAIVALTAAAAVYGLAVGNLPMHVMVAAYQVAVIPAYFFLATHTLTSARRMRAAGILYVAAAAALVGTAMAAPGRHGGLIPLLAIPPMIVLAGRTRGWRRAGLVVLAAAFTTDVALASYRAIWLAAGVAALVMLIRGRVAIRRWVAAAAVVAGALLLACLVVSSGVRDRASVAVQELQRSSGYRVSESSVGLDVFAARPFVGAGLGQSIPDTYLAGFAATDVGPTYHAFYVTILANLGLVGLCIVLWPVFRALRAGLAERSGMALAFAALTCGFLAAALFAGPTDGHWELGLFPALTLLASRPGLTTRPSGVPK
ncbi:O-antigen ligase family protein [Micromonospora sp. CPCC 206061]|uniref:O-antigen ligase family protein n=1 Tax=Micromonospora sp. CPCC 206061 TaxID=3122410 RepID=UPI002FF43373